MEMSPQQVRNASFKSAKRGFDPDEVQAFLRDVAESLEAAQNQSTAMEARARAAVARLQEVSTAREASPAPVSSGDAETISRTLLLAQRTADATVSEAKSEADRIVTAAHEEAASTIDSTREMSSRLLEEARAEARSVSEVELKAAQGEVEALLARRDFLESDVDQLEHFLVDQRDRLRQAASAMLDISERVPGGLGEVRRPLLSASDDPASSLDSRSGRRPGDRGRAMSPARSATDEPSPARRSTRRTRSRSSPPTIRKGTGHRRRTSRSTRSRRSRTPWAAEPDDEPQFRFGLGETRRYE